MKDQDYRKIALTSGFPVSPRGKSIWRVETSLYSFDGQGSSCPKCGGNLGRNQTEIPVNQTEEATIPLLYCSRCQRYYVRDSNKIVTLLRDNNFAKEFTLDEKPLWNVTQIENQEKKRQRRLEKREKKRRQKLEEDKFFSTLLEPIESAVVLLKIRYENQEEKNYIIVNNSQESAPQSGVYHYSSCIARELLSAAFYESRKSKGALDSRKFHVVRYFFNDDSHETAFESIVPVELNIKPGGGLATHIKNRNREEVVDVLMYSPFTGRYEIIRATFEKNNGYSFVDICLYRDFVKKYGNPRVKLLFEQSSHAWNDLSQLKSESVLMGYGYNVSQADGLSDKERQELLAEIIDLEILPADKIISFLGFLIRLHDSSSKYEIACCKWEEDKEFVKNYRAAPERFLIAK